MKPKIYLDANILIDVFDGQDVELAELIKDSVHSEIFEFPFTATQIAEVTGPLKNDRDAKRLEALSLISKNIYLYSATNTLQWKSESPATVWDTINEVPDSGEMLELATFIPHDALVEMRSELGLDPRHLNNFSGLDAVTEIDRALTRVKNTRYPNAPGTMKDMMDMFEFEAPRLMNGVYNAAGKLDRSFDVKDRVLMAFSFLHTYGYWPDSKGIYNKGSGIPDGQHVINAVHYNFLASRDRGMRNRAAAAYSILEVETHLLDVSQLKTLLREC